MRAIIKKWGTSASVRIPAGIIESGHLGLNDVVNIREEGGRIIIEAIRDSTFNLAQMLADITPENMHAEIDFGAPVGEEKL